MECCKNTAIRNIIMKPNLTSYSHRRSGNILEYFKHQIIKFINHILSIKIRQREPFAR